MRPSPARLLPRLGGGLSSGVGGSGSNGAPRLARTALAAAAGRVGGTAFQLGPMGSMGDDAHLHTHALALACGGHSSPSHSSGRKGGGGGAAAANLTGPQQQQQQQQQRRAGLLRPRLLSTLTHVDAGSGRPAMVDVGGKPVTKREARARCRVVLPPEAMSALLQVEEQGRKEVLGKKGPVFATAIVAGVMGAKRTSELVPFCHPLALDDCQIDLRFDGPSRPNEVVVDCRVKIQGRTGVEMEAMTGASVAALCIYDMCKAASHDILIKDLQLLAKSGGKKGAMQRAESTSQTAPRSLSAAATPPEQQQQQPQQQQPPSGNKKKEQAAVVGAAKQQQQQELQHAAAVERGKRLVMTSTYKGLNGGHPPSSFSSYSRPPSPSSVDGGPPPPAPTPAEARAGYRRMQQMGAVRQQMQQEEEEEAEAIKAQQAKAEAPVVDYCI